MAIEVCYKWAVEVNSSQQIDITTTTRAAKRHFASSITIDFWGSKVDFLRNFIAKSKIKTQIASIDCFILFMLLDGILANKLTDENDGIIAEHKTAAW